MSETDQSFLPQIVGLFYATFDPTLGPTITHQVPEDLITSSDEPASRSASRTRSSSGSPSRSRSRSRAPLPRGRSVSRARNPDQAHASLTQSPARSTSSTRDRSPRVTRSRASSPDFDPLQTTVALLDFAPISDYVIPKKALTGKLVTFLTTGRDERQTEYRVMGFPCVLSGEGGKYVRNEYMWNLCFVFEVGSSLEAFEPVVRKCARILRSAELDSAYLSAPSSNHTSLPAVLEQLFEDLNSYSETSIPLDGFNSLELKLFPFYPNPPECEDWHVPIALADFAALKDDNWDITAARVSLYIDGVNHVGRIAELADADPALVRETLRHMLFYQVIMMVDIFQYSNMYTLKPSIAHLVSDVAIVAECGPYVVRKGYPKPAWPALLRLYAKLQPGLTVHTWIEDNEVLSLGIDPRRFVSFGIIKGFLRRVHRWPVMIDRSTPILPQSDHPRRRVEFKAQFGSATTLSTRPGDSGLIMRNGQGDSTFTLRSMDSRTSLGVSPGSGQPTSANLVAPQIPASGSAARTPPSVTRSPARRPVPFTSVRDSYQRSLASAGETQPSTGSRRGHPGYHHTNSGYGQFHLRGPAQRAREADERRFEEDLTRYLDGSHHADEIQVRFGMGWGQLERLLGVGDLKEGRGKKGVTLILR